MSKETGWYPSHIKPARKGVYRRKFAVRAAWYAYWTGSRWNFASPTVNGAVQERGPSLNQDLPWCGLAKNPKAKA